MMTGLNGMNRIKKALALEYMAFRELGWTLKLTHVYYFGAFFISSSTSSAPFL